MTDTASNVPHGISEWDFGELLLFHHKVEYEGFSYAFEEYRPDFRDPELREDAENRDTMHALYDKYRETIDSMDWQVFGQMYDAHLDATRTAGA